MRSCRSATAVSHHHVLCSNRCTVFHWSIASNEIYPLRIHRHSLKAVVRYLPYGFQSLFQCHVEPWTWFRDYISKWLDGSSCNTKFVILVRCKCNDFFCFNSVASRTFLYNYDIMRWSNIKQTKKTDCA